MHVTTTWIKYAENEDKLHQKWKCTFN